MARTFIDPSLIPSLAPTNILINGGFEIWQRGASFTSTNTAVQYTADRWYCNGNTGQSIAITKETTLMDSGLAAMKVVATNANSNGFSLVQPIEIKEAYFGKTLTLRVRVKTTVANTIVVGFYIGTGANYVWSAFHTGSGNYETLTVTGTLGTSFGAAFNVYVGAPTVALTNGATFYVDSAMLAIGPSPVAFIPTDFQVDLARCQRYFEKSYDVGTAVATATTTGLWAGPGVQTNTSTRRYAGPTFRVTKRTTPTIVLYDTTGATGNALYTSTSDVNTQRASSAASTTLYGFQYRSDTATEAYMGGGHWTADAEM